MAQRLPQSNQPYCITKLFGKFSVTSFLIVALKAGEDASLVVETPEKK